MALARARISFSVVPGVTSALGSAAYAGIPLTHRDHAHSVTSVTGHADKNGLEPDWRALATSGATAVFYMGLGNMAHIVARLLEHGAAPTLPAAVIAHGTLPSQRVIAATLATIESAVSAASLESPALLVVGEVVAMSATLAWFNAVADADVSRSA